jgi:hypothetical protein
MPVTLTDEHIAQLNNIVLDIPTRYGLPIVNLINAAIQEEQAGKELEKQMVADDKKPNAP